MLGGDALAALAVASEARGKEGKGKSLGAAVRPLAEPGPRMVAPRPGAQSKPIGSALKAVGRQPAATALSAQVLSQAQTFQPAKARPQSAGQSIEGQPPGQQPRPAGRLVRPRYSLPTPTNQTGQNVRPKTSPPVAQETRPGGLSQQASSSSRGGPSLAPRLAQPKAAEKPAPVAQQPKARPQATWEKPTAVAWQVQPEARPRVVPPKARPQAPPEKSPAVQQVPPQMPRRGTPAALAVSNPGVQGSVNTGPTALYVLVVCTQSHSLMSCVRCLRLRGSVFTMMSREAYDDPNMVFDKFSAFWLLT